MATRGPITTTGGWDNPSGRNLSADERDTIRKLISAGYSHRDIGIRIGRGKATVSRAARSMGFMPAKAKRPWTQEEDKKLMHMLNQGLSQRKIAEALHRHHPEISYRIWFIRSRAEAGKEVRYMPVHQGPTGAPTARAEQSTPLYYSEPSSPLGLSQEIDLWRVWNSIVFANDKG